MYRVSVASLAFTCALAVSFVPVIATANPEVGATGNGLSVQEELYLERYAAAQQKFGSAAVGANVVDDGTGKHEAYQVPEAIVAEKVERLGSMLNPPPPPTSSESVATGAPAPISSGTGSYSIPSDIVACESGGDYSAVNPSSGAYGAYQILPSTSAAYGCDMSSPAGQDACAAEIYADVGSSAWVC